MFHGLSTIDISNFFELDTYGRTRGHLLKLKKGRVSTDLHSTSSLRESSTFGTVLLTVLFSRKVWTVSSPACNGNITRISHRLDACCPIDFRGWSSTGEASIRWAIRWAKLTPQNYGEGLQYGENCMILTSTVFVWSTRVTDGETDGRWHIARYALCCCALKGEERYTSKSQVVILQLFFFFGGGALRGRLPWKLAYVLHLET